jgi:hypothetical protein
MGGPSQTEEISAEPDGLALQTIPERLARGKDMIARTAENIAPKKRKAIEDMLRKGVPVSRIAVETSSGNGTVALVRQELIEREPELFKRSMATTLQRIAHKAATTIERSIDTMIDEGVKPNQVPGLSVALGILIDKQAALAGDPAVSVVEHRLKVDPDAVKEALLRLTQRPESDVINVTATSSASSEVTVGQ